MFNEKQQLEVLSKKYELFDRLKTFKETGKHKTDNDFVANELMSLIGKTNNLKWKRIRQDYNMSEIVKTLTYNEILTLKDDVTGHKPIDNQTLKGMLTKLNKFLK